MIHHIGGSLFGGAMLGAALCGIPGAVAGGVFGAVVGFLAARAESRR